MPTYVTATVCKADTALADLSALGDAAVDKLIDRAERIIDAWTRQNFRSRTDTLFVTGSGSRMLILPERLAVLTTVKFLDLDDGGAVVLSSEEIKDIFNRFWYLIAEPNFSTPRSRGPRGRFPDQEDNIEIAGDWGYASVPPEVSDATCLVVERIFVTQGNKSLISGEFQSERIGDYKYERFDDPVDRTNTAEMRRLLPAEARLLLKKFMKPILPRVP